MREVALDIRGLGLILYSPPAVAHIPEGADYLRSDFWNPADVARHVMECQLTAFATGSPGSFRFRFTEGLPDEAAVQAAAFKLRLGLHVRSGTICVRDLYDLMEWSAECPAPQQLRAADGWYRLTVFSSPPPSGILGDGQVVEVALERVSHKPALQWEGVPPLHS
ncbi:hypothetical protein [Urbifossiella limnaea]|uniref:Uncharacterized protein n=1 Tax=Urbifossiella limnaea TaxID=2528023 RepID=A0A517XQS4_9BACT|nr:hypothetical protein [Urbifossiella limnaea]QDU19856.1 hypothetical protein ETAA1_17940 [Urbifossiella limnaea]